MRVAIFICAVLAFAALSQEGSAKKLKKKHESRKQGVQTDGVIQKLPPFSPDDPIWIALKDIISKNISENVYVFVVYLETFAGTRDMKYIVVMNNQNEDTLYQLSAVFNPDYNEWAPAYVHSYPLEDEAKTNKKD